MCEAFRRFLGGDQARLEVVRQVVPVALLVE